ncbi:hypothetical protein NIES267_26970 [Calothrix parasitica NIES-267]|uniref:M23ase beta-sheet core domain-containing protein n=1 Tax=Calothrix parasitica NIES-267 TaxID=1973488 RepID=A0A1Z4LPP0_9CYAN|nr:hypothetical protein NIES267_26970 [Calothrix parasitica NIES-267]
MFEVTSLDNTFDASTNLPFNNPTDTTQVDYKELSSSQLMDLAGEALIDAWQYQANINQAVIYGVASIFKNDFTANAEIAFGESFDTHKAQTLGDEILGGQYGVLPNIEFHSNTQMKGASGAYSQSTNTILFNSDYLINNTGNPTSVGKTVVEETAHFLDASANPVDSPGDEGKISAGLVAGETYTADELQRLKTENDSTILVIDGQELKVEQSSGNEPYNNFGSPGEIITSWAATFYHFNGQENPNFDDTNKIGTVNLGSNVRDDGQWGMNSQNWGSGSPAPDVPDDLFAMQAYTRRNLIKDNIYEVWVRSDDGYQVLAHKLDGEPFDITPNALNGEWQPGAYGDPVKYEFVAPETGTFDFKINMFETYGDAYVDLVLKDVTPNPAIPDYTYKESDYLNALYQDDIYNSMTRTDHNGTSAFDSYDAPAGTPADGKVYALVGGEVIEAQNGKEIKNWAYNGTIAIYNEELDKTFIYWHFAEDSIDESLEGETIAAGSLIGIEGNTGLSYGSHTHLEVHEGKQTVDMSNVNSPKSPANSGRLQVADVFQEAVRRGLVKLYK